MHGQPSHSTFSAKKATAHHDDEIIKTDNRDDEIVETNHHDDEIVEAAHHNDEIVKTALMSDDVIVCTTPPRMQPQPQPLRSPSASPPPTQTSLSHSRHTDEGIAVIRPTPRLTSLHSSILQHSDIELFPEDENAVKQEMPADDVTLLVS